MIRGGLSLLVFVASVAGWSGVARADSDSDAGNEMQTASGSGERLPERPPANVRSSGASYPTGAPTASPLFAPAVRSNPTFHAKLKYGIVAGVTALTGAVGTILLFSVLTCPTVEGNALDSRCADKMLEAGAFFAAASNVAMLVGFPILAVLEKRSRRFASQRQASALADDGGATEPRDRPTVVTLRLYAGPAGLGVFGAF